MLRGMGVILACLVALGLAWGSPPAPQRVALQPQQGTPTAPQGATPVPTRSDMPVFLFFSNPSRDTALSGCGRVYPVERRIPRTEERARTALELLFTGPSMRERALGYTSPFSPRTRSLLRGVYLMRRVAYVDLDPAVRRILPGAPSTCDGQALMNQIEYTLRSAAGASRVVLALDGSPTAFYTWMLPEQPCNEPICTEAAFARAAQLAATPTPTPTGAETPTPRVTAGSPEATVVDFYEWYLTAPRDPLATGAYWDSPLLTRRAKERIARALLLYRAFGYDPLHLDALGDGLRIVDSTTRRDGATVMARVGSEQQLLRVDLMRAGGRWLIDDLNPAPDED